jgi:23S rRNA G2445 N2-methylase RlmL
MKAPLHDPARPSRFAVTVARGLEDLLERELRELGGTITARVPGGVACEGPLTLGMRICMWSRVAQRVILRLGHDSVRNERQLQAAIRHLPLQDFFHPDAPLRVDAHCRGPVFTNSIYAAQLAKDAICDVMRRHWKRRPDVSLDAPHVVFDLQILDEEAWFGIALQGDSLHMRGYRVDPSEAPLRETLAAGLLMKARWDLGQEPLHDPMCGSGTILAEAAMMLADHAPGLRRTFGFERWPGFETLQEDWVLLREEAEQRVRPRIRRPLLGTDLSERALAQARRNLDTLGIEGPVLAQADARTLGPMDPPGLFAFNPPYGQRMEARTEGLLEAVGDALLRCTDHRVAVICPDELLPALGMRWDRRQSIANGPIRCALAVSAPIRERRTFKVRTASPAEGPPSSSS